MQFLRGILVAKFLGPYFFGVWGFLMLVNQYLQYTSLGLQYAINVELAVNALSDTQKKKKYIGVALTLALLIAVTLFVVGLVVQIYEISLFTKYNFSKYAITISLIVGLTHIKEIYANIYRVYGKLNRIIFSELLFACLPLLAVLIFSGESLITALLVAMIVSIVIALVVFTISAPFPIVPQLDIASINSLLAIGLPLLIYNLSFGLIAITGRTIISVFYSVETLGYFALANSITSATLLGLRAVTWVVFPSLLTKTRLGLPDQEVRFTVQKINDLYSTAVFLVVFSIIFFIPILFIILPDYKPVLGVLTILLLMQALLSVSFGYNTMAIARKKQLNVAGISFIAVIFVLIVGGFVGWQQWDIVWVAVAMLGSGVVFIILQARLGSLLLNHGKLQPGYLTTILPLGSIVAVVFFVLGTLLAQPMVFGGVGFLIFIFTRRQSISRLWFFALAKVSVR